MRWTFAVPIALSLLVYALCALAAPVEETPYGKAGLRLEMRPNPQDVKDPGPRARYERDLAAAGFQARWIDIAWVMGEPLIPNKALPTIGPQDVENERILRDWVKDIHGAGMACLSWYPLIFCKPAFDKLPDWRQQFVLGDPPSAMQGMEVCINGPYGQALIDYCNEAIDKTGLDGIWFDGAAWSLIWGRPFRLTCACKYCQAKFKAETGRDLPRKLDWSDPTWRVYINWRYETFGAYIKRLAAGIRAKHPNAAVVINHYHRPGITYPSAIPLNPYGADIISGSEASGEAPTDLTIRLCRAYGRPQSEVWRPFTVGPNPEAAPETEELVQHALTCYTAGGMPVYGGGGPGLNNTGRLVSPIVNGLRPYLSGDAVKHVAIHVSQQAETFYLSRAQEEAGTAAFWELLSAWTQECMAQHLPPDYVYDKSLTPEGLRGYKVLLLPLSQALSAKQASAVLGFARNGGLVVVGPATGELNEWGEPAHSALGQALSFQFGALPGIEWERMRPGNFSAPGGKPGLASNFLAAPLKLSGAAWKPLYTREDATPAAAVRSFGGGQVIVTSADWGRPGAGRKWTDSVDSQTRMDIVAPGSGGVAAGGPQVVLGKRVLRFTDSLKASPSFMPDMEMRPTRFELPAATGGRMSCDLLTEGRTDVIFEARSFIGPILGPQIIVGGGGQMTAGGRPVCRIPLNQWVHLSAQFRFTQPGKPSTFDLTVTLPDGSAQTFRDLPSQEGRFNACDWAVLYGNVGEGIFAADNILIEALAPDGKTTTAFSEDFEGLPEGPVRAPTPLPELIRLVSRLAPPPIAVKADARIRAGLFRLADGSIAVHLHNLDGTRKQWLADEGPAVTITSKLPVQTVELSLHKAALPVIRRGGSWEVAVPHVGLHEVVQLRLAQR
jgi:hypothetical protein